MKSNDLFSKIEIWVENSTNIDELKNALIETISNNNVNLEEIYNIHKKSIDKQFIKYSES